MKVILSGPTMGFVLTCAVTSTPLHFISRISWHDALLIIPVIAVACLLAWGRFAPFGRVTDLYCALVTSVAFLVGALTFAAFGMEYLRRFIE